MDDNTNSVEQLDLVRMVIDLEKKVRELQAELMRIRKLLQT